MKQNCVNVNWGHGYCKNHQYLRPPKEKREQVNHRGLFVREIEPIQVGENDLAAWFKDKMKNSPRVCQNCGKSLLGLNDTDWMGSQHHVLYKEHFKSVKSHPNNHLVLGKFCCHTQIHTSHENAAKMDIFPKAKEIVISLLSELTKEELRRIPKIYNLT